MIREAIDRILALAEPNVVEIGDETYSDKQLIRMTKPLASPLRMTTLTSLVEYMKHNAAWTDTYMVHVVSPIEVDVVSELNDDRNRETLVKVVAALPEFDFNSQIDRETFTIGVQSKFVEGVEDDKALILKFAGTVKNGSVAEYSDDGISQKATVKKGVSSLTEAVVPSPCKLTPYRTFTEVKQPTSDFIFRLSEGREGDVRCALYEADGGAWRNEAMNNIKEYLKTELGDRHLIIS